MSAIAIPISHTISSTADDPCIERFASPVQSHVVQRNSAGSRTAATTSTTRRMAITTKMMTSTSPSGDGGMFIVSDDQRKFVADLTIPTIAAVNKIWAQVMINIGPKMTKAEKNHLIRNVPKLRS